MNLSSNFYLVYKPKTWTSQDLCTKIKKTYKFRKVGHSGTLDPNAEGLMLIATNGFTKLFDYIENSDKTYKVKALIGYSSPTIDIDSEFKKIRDIDVSSYQKEIESFLVDILGSSTQTPPIFSAIKVKGKRLYKYARQNKEVDIPKRTIHVKDTQLLSTVGSEIEFLITVSKGTYIRSIVYDLGKHLDTEAIVKELVRTKVGNHDINDPEVVMNAELLDQDYVMKPINWESLLSLPHIDLDKESNLLIKNGQFLSNDLFEEKTKHIVTIENEIKAIYEPFNDKYFKPDKVIIWKLIEVLVKMIRLNL